MKKIIINLKVKLTIMGILLFFPASIVFADSSIFSTAEKYTVKIRSKTEYPFIKDYKGTLSGAGFLVSKELGWIVTNAHVSTRNPSKIEVSFKGKKYVEGELVYVDRLMDLAFIKISQGNIPDESKEASLDCSSDPEVGTAVGAYGHPFSLSYSGTRGIVSGMRYKWNRFLIQTDAAINKGNSGGPLISFDTGKVVGINTASYSKNMSEGIGFAVSMNRVCKVLQLLKDGKDPTPPYVPVSFGYDADNEEELRVAKVYKQTPVRWNLRENDIIISLSKDTTKHFKNQADLIHSLRGKEGDVELIINRTGKEQSVWVPVKIKPNLMHRVGLHVSGIVIAEDSLKDDEVMNVKKLLMIHNVESSSLGDTAVVLTSSYLSSVDGQLINSIYKLCIYFKNAEKEKKKVSLITKDIDWEYSARSKYLYHEIDVENVKIVGPNIGKDCECRALSIKSSLQEKVSESTKECS